MQLSEYQTQVLDLVDSADSVREVFTASPLTDADTVRVLTAFHQVGILALDERQSPAEPILGPRTTPEPASVEPFEKELISMYNDFQCRNHWQVLGLDPDAATPDNEACLVFRHPPPNAPG